MNSAEGFSRSLLQFFPPKDRSFMEKPLASRDMLPRIYTVYAYTNVDT